MKNKAMSNLIVVVLFIVIGIIMVSIVLVAIKSFASKPSQLKYSPKSCIEMQASPPIELERVCYDSGNKDLQVQLKRKPSDVIISQIGFVLNSEDKSSSWKCDEKCGNCRMLKEGETDFYYISAQQKPESLNLAINNCVVNNKKIKLC